MSKDQGWYVIIGLWAIIVLLGFIAGKLYE